MAAARCRSAARSPSRSGGSHRLDRSAAEEMLPQGLTLALTRLQFEKRVILEEGDDPKRRIRLQYPGVGEDIGIARVVIA